MDISLIQSYLKEHSLDGWLMADFHGRNTIAVTFLGLESIMLTRRFFYWIPSQGDPIVLVNPVEGAKFSGVSGTVIQYKGYKQLEAELGKLLEGGKKIAMEYSPKGRLPYVGLVEAGTIELVRELGAEIVSSADMVADFQARLSPEQMAMHRLAHRNLMEIKDAAFDFISDCLSHDTAVTEYEVSQFIEKKWREYDMIVEHIPNCSVGPHAGDPHYEPGPDGSSIIKRGDIILIDIATRVDDPNGIYGDITWMAFAGTRDEIPQRYRNIFSVLVAARDAAIQHLRDHLGSGPVYGADVDDACRAVMEAAELGDAFTHRTGHSIMQEVHGPGPNIDNLETEDRRELQPGHLFSIEPGAYFDDCGFRTETDCLITPEGVEIAAGPLQTEITALL